MPDLAQFNSIDEWAIALHEWAQKKARR